MILVECAWAATKTKNTYLSAKYKALLNRGLGKAKALIAIAHKMLVSIYHMLKDKTDYKDLGNDYLLKYKNIDRIKENYINKLQSLGFEVVVAHKI